MDEQGSAPIEFAAGVLLLLIPMLVLILSLAPALERRVLARSLAADIGRSVALAGGTVSDVVRGEWLGRIRESGLASDDVVVALCGAPSVAIEDLATCADPHVVGVVVRVRVGGVVSEVEDRHSQPMPRFRSAP